MLSQTDLEVVINDFKKNSMPNDRYTSFDYCYNYFRSTSDLEADLEKSCLVLGFYLASWGMFRGSSFLLNKSLYHLKPTIIYINNLDDSCWEIDVDKYDEKNIAIILRIYEEIKKLLIPNGNQALTLVTKVLLGVFGFVPAFDRKFCESFRQIFQGRCGFRSLNENSLNFIHKFYLENRTSIDSLSSRTFTTDFTSGGKTKISYPKAKIIDMYGFNKNSITMTEKVFEIASEGGSICIVRHGNEFVYQRDEFNPITLKAEEFKEVKYQNFKEPFHLIDKKYPWYLLQLEAVHDDYKDFVTKKLIKKLNNNAIPAEELTYSIDSLEKCLNIELNMTATEGKPTWSYKRK